MVVCYADARQIIEVTPSKRHGKIDADAGLPPVWWRVTFSVVNRCLIAGTRSVDAILAKAITALDTSGCAWSSFEQVLPYTDLVLYDLKLK